MENVKTGYFMMARRLLCKTDVMGTEGVKGVK
jgi:hypothetical protein